MLRLNATEGLTDDELRDLVPSAFTLESANVVSRLYKHITTSTLINDMRLLGWYAADAKQVKARKGSTIGFQKHLIVFMNENLKIIQDDGEEVYPQILLVNSHDGRSSFTFIAGLFRMICENGLVISTQEFESIKIRHMGYNFEELQEKIQYMVENLPLTIESMEKMKKIEMDFNASLDFAKKAIQFRFDKDELDTLAINYGDLIKPTREEDADNSLWALYNLVQEKIIKGNFHYHKAGKVRNARKILNFNKDIQINKELFNLAYEYVT